MEKNKQNNRFLCPYMGRCKKCIHRLSGMCTVLSAAPSDSHGMLFDTCPFYKTLTSEELSKVQAIYDKLLEAKQGIVVTEKFLDYLDMNFGILSR